MSIYKGFTGGTYAGRSLTAAGDRAENLYPESVASGDPENPYCLLSTPGHEQFALLPTHPLQQVFTEPSSGRVFAVSGGTFYEVKSGGAYTVYVLVEDGPYMMESNSIQVMLTCAAGRTGYIFTLLTSVFVKITSAGFLGAVSVRMIDNYFLCRVGGSTPREWQISALLDGLTWDALDIALSEGGSDNIVADLADHREYWTFGSQHTEIFVNSGAALFPFTRLNSVYIQQGTCAEQSPVALDSSVYWLGQNKNGTCRVYTAPGFIPVGVSTPAVEWWFNQYAKRGQVSDAVGYGYQDEDGHSFYVLTFPSATCEPGSTGGMVDGVVNGATWVYDVGEKQWHERKHLDPVTGKDGRTLGTYHTFGFGKHLVGGTDGTGKIYDMSVDIFTDNGHVIKRRRVAPHLTDDLKMIVHESLQLNAQVGNGPNGDPNNTVTMRASNDGGLTWGGEYQKALGDTGQYDTTVEWRMLGRSRRRVYEISTMIKAAVCWVAAYLRVKPGAAKG